jgi:hypothetical protein
MLVKVNETGQIGIKSFINVNCEVIKLPNHYTKGAYKAVIVRFHSFLTSSPDTKVRSDLLRHSRPRYRPRSGFEVVTTMDILHLAGIDG